MTKGIIAPLLAGTAAWLITTDAAAQTAPAGTTAGSTITNTAQASYTVNGTAATATSNPATFVVDRKVNLTVTAQAANTPVTRGQTGAVAVFTVTNNTNGTQDLLLDPDQVISVGIIPGVDDYDLSGLRAFVDANGNGTYEPGTDTATYIDELPADASRTVFLVGDVPQTGTLAYASLHVTVAAGGGTGTQGAALIPTDLNIVNQNNEVDIVFADGDSDGTLGRDIARNGQGRAYTAFELASAVNLSIVKTSRVISDGINTLNPKALPGAVVEYCLTVANRTPLISATGIAISDPLPANITYVPGSLTVGGIGAGGACLVNGFPQNDDGTQAAGPYGGSYDAAARTVRATIPTLLGGTSLAASFRATIN